MGSLCDKNEKDESKEELETTHLLTLFDRKYDQSLIEELIAISKGACKKLHWDKLNDNCFEVSVLTGGLSNKLYTISVIDNKNNVVSKDNLKGVIRIFNERTELTFDEMYNIYCAFYDSGIGTNVLGRFEKGQIENFIEGESLKDVELRTNSNLYLQTAKILATIHNINGVKYCQTLDSTKPKTNETFQTYLKLISNIFEDEVKKQSDMKKWEFMTSDIDDTNLNNDLFISIIQNEITWLNNEIINYKYGYYIQDIVFSHNDLHGGNVMHNKDNGILKVIDYEFSGYNYRCFDFGNYYNELHINNDSGSPPGFEIVLDHFPSKEYQYEFSKAYFEQLLSDEEYKNEDINGKLDNICNGMKLGCLLSHMQWGLWGVSESIRNDPAWDYLEYGRQRLVHFYRVKKEYLNHKQ